jgi:hypothetical protein
MRAFGRHKGFWIWGLAVITGGSAWAAYAWRQTASQGPPSLYVDRDYHDFGTVRQERSDLIHTFQIRNTGNVPVSLKVASRGCACLAVDCPEEVKPGGTARVEVHVAIETREGPMETYALLATSDPACLELPLHVRFFSVPPVVANPKCLRFTDVTRGDVLVKEFDLVVPAVDESREQTDADWRCVALKEGLRIRPVPPKSARGQTKMARRVYRFQATVDTSLLPSGNSVAVNDAISLEVKDAAASEPLLFRVPLEVYFRHHPALRGQASVVLSRSDRDSVASLTLETYDEGKFRIDRITCSPEDVISAESANGEPASKQTVLVRLKPSANSSVRQASVDVFTKEYSEKPFRLSVLLVD